MVNRSVANNINVRCIMNNKKNLKIKKIKYPTAFFLITLNIELFPSSGVVGFFKYLIGVLNVQNCVIANFFCQL